MLFMLCLTKNNREDCCVRLWFLCSAGLVDINNKGVYGSYLIKKRHFWQYYIDGINIKNNFTNNGIGSMNVLGGDLENVHLRVFSMKERDCLMVLIFNYSRNERVGQESSGNLVERL